MCDVGHIIFKAFKKWPLWTYNSHGKKKMFKSGRKLILIPTQFCWLMIHEQATSLVRIQLVWVEQSFPIFQGFPSPLKGRTVSCAFELLFFSFRGILHLSCQYKEFRKTHRSRQTKANQQKPKKKITSPHCCESTHPLLAVDRVLCLRYLGVDSWAFAIVDFQFYTEMGSPRVRGQVSLLLHIPCCGLSIVFANEASW